MSKRGHFLFFDEEGRRSPWRPKDMLSGPEIGPRGWLYYTTRYRILYIDSRGRRTDVPIGYRTDLRSFGLRKDGPDWLSTIVHDYHCDFGDDRAHGDWVYLDAMTADNVHPARRWSYYLGVRGAWLAWGKWAAMWRRRASKRADMPASPL